MARKPTDTSTGAAETPSEPEVFVQPADNTATAAVQTATEPEVFEQSTDNTSTGAVEFGPEGTTTVAHYPGTFTISYADPGPVVVSNSWRGDVTAKVIEPPADDTPIFDATAAETEGLPDAETTDVAAAETK